MDHEMKFYIDAPTNQSKTLRGPSSKPKNGVKKFIVLKKPDLTAKRAVELLLSGSLQKKVCRYCLKISSVLTELDQILQIAINGVLYKVTVKTMVAGFYPYKISDDPNLPNKICNKCLNQVMRAYLFTLQCERSERALSNFLTDVNDKFEKLDPIETADKPKKRGRRKNKVNHNVLNVEHNLIKDYAEPLINIVNNTTSLFLEETEINKLECPKCWQVLPNYQSYINHEKSHPSTMWYTCRLCGQSFVKHSLYKKHLQAKHINNNLLRVSTDTTKIKCTECGIVNDTYNEHLQHVEKHKFQRILNCLLERKLHRHCAVCFNEDSQLLALNKMICLNGGFPELNGDRSLYTILGATIPDMNILHNYTSKKICEKCYNSCISTYIFINHTNYIRSRLNICVSQMLEKLNDVNETQTNLFIEISKESILPARRDEYDEALLYGSDIDESKLKFDVLEDEFRETESETESEDEKSEKVEITKEKLVNGFVDNENVCTEFLTFKKKIKRRMSYTCPVCSKHFVSDYFLNKHILKHKNRKIYCKCGGTFKSKFDLNEHKKMVHILQAKKYNTCKVCCRTFLSENKFKKHLKSHVKKECVLCCKYFGTQKSYNSHMQRHATRLLQKKKKHLCCSFCEQESFNDNDLSVHVNKVHLNLKPYNCDMCDKQFYTDYNMRCHKKQHSMKTEEMCKLCGKTKRCRRDLVVHVRKHMNQKPFNCPLCKECFYVEFSAKRHMIRVHGGVFYCNLCNATFAKRAHLKDHVNSEHNFN